MGRELTLETVTPAELSPDELDLWASFVAADPRFSSPYFHPRFTQIAGEVAPGAAVSILHRRGRVVGFFPHQRRGGAAQPIGAPLNDYHAVITEPGLDIPLEALPDLIGAASLGVTGWSGPGAEGEGVIARQTLQADLSDGWAAYDAGRRADWHKYFKDKDRARRSLERDHGAVLARTDSRDPALLERLIALKSDQYRRSRLHDIFACGWTADLLRALLADTAVQGFGARLAVLEAGGEPVAFEYGLHAGAHYHFWFPAYEASVARYSPGILLSLETMRQGSAEGFRVFDYGFEGEPYKKYFCNRSQTVLEGVAQRRGYAGAMSAAFSMAGVDAALAAGERLAGAGLALSVRRRWAAIDACETTVAGRARGIAAAAAAALNKTRPQSAVSALGAMLIL
ncbi:MAG: GNAT family N-acetyltransferase [Caulobacter sp.]|nr:GNAT family N-acetyltransferase [Caulobacter sp.]